MVSETPVMRSKFATASGSDGAICIKSVFMLQI
jgi:hypothetical protein